MNRTIEQYAKCDPFQVVSGSHAQALHFAKDAKADIAELAARIAALEAENADLRKALIGCRSNICGYILNGSQEQADAVVQRLYEEVSRINAVACAALEAKP